MQNTESFGRWNIGQTLTATQTPPFTLKVSYVPFNESEYITINPDTVNEEIIFYTTKTGTSGGAGTINVTARGYNKHNTSTDVANQREHDINSIFKLTDNHIILAGKADILDLASTSASKGASTIGVQDAGTYFVSTNVEWALQELAAGAPWVANASETVAGKVELATDSELGALTSTGGTGARLGLSTSNATITQVANKLPVTDANGRLIKYLNSQADGASSTSEKGLVEMATDSEATTGVDQTRYINSKQVKDNYEWISQIVYGWLFLFDDTSKSDITITHSLGKTPKSIEAIYIKSWSSPLGTTPSGYWMSNRWTITSLAIYDGSYSRVTTSDATILTHISNNWPFNIWDWRVSSVTSSNITFSYTIVSDGGTWNTTTEEVYFKITA